MDIKNSRRITFLGARDSGTLDIIQDLTGSSPAPNINGSTAGLTHEWSAQTAYYSAKIPIWIDEVPSISDWKSEFLKPEAKEVVEAVGAWIFCFARPADGKVNGEVEEAMKGIQEVVDEHSYGSDTVLLAVSKPVGKLAQENDSKSREEQDDICMQYGFEYIEYGTTGQNEFGEKLGFERLKEALEANEWAGAGNDEELDLDDLDFDAEDDIDGFGREEAEMTAELFGMKAALNGDDDFNPTADDFMSPKEQAGQVDDLDRMMSKLLAVKEQSADLPEEQRKRMAAKAVRDILKDTSGV